MRANGPYVALACNRRMLMQAAKLKRQAPQAKKVPKCLRCWFETQNMSDGRSALVIQAGSWRG
eukprot:5197284-Amphidinium_carterae.1